MRTADLISELLRHPVIRSADHPGSARNAIDEAFRRTRLQAPELLATLARGAGRWGNKLRRQVVRASRDRPWSAGERRLHTMLREAGITGWLTNHEVWLAGRRRFLDLDDPAYVRALVTEALRVARRKPRRRPSQAGGSRVR